MVLVLENNGLFVDKFQKLIWSPNDNFDTLKKEFLIFENEIY